MFVKMCSVPNPFRSFFLDVDCVTNDQFAKFVRDTGYTTEAEDYGFAMFMLTLSTVC